MTGYTNMDEYLHPDLYDLENPDFEPDGLMFLDYARQTGGPLLDIGCGTGRMTIPLAQHGLDVTGVELFPAMLERAKAKAGDLPIHWVEGDARNFHLGRTFGLILEGGCVFMHMLTRADQEAYLARVVEHLAPHGRFVVSIFFPHPDRLATELEEKDWFTYQDEQGRPVRVSGYETYDELAQIKVETAVRHVSGADGEETVYVAPLSLRYTFPQEMEALLDHAGLVLLNQAAGLVAQPVMLGLCVMIVTQGLLRRSPESSPSPAVNAQH